MEFGMWPPAYRGLRLRPGGKAECGIKSSEGAGLKVQGAGGSVLREFILAISFLLMQSSPLSDPEHRQLLLYAKEKPDHFHVYDADIISYNA